VRKPALAILLLSQLRNRMRLRLAGTVRSESPATPQAACSGSRSRAIARLGWFFAVVVLLHLATVLAMDAAWPELRDPEYGRRAESLRERVNENPGRPVVVLMGSSRTAMGVKPSAWEAVRPGTPHDPMLFNMALVGSGPIMELMALRRVYADGFRPAVILVEYWPPFLRQDGEYSDGNRIDPRRLRYDDRALIRDYCPNARNLEWRMWGSRVNALGDNRQKLLVQADPDLTPRAVPIDAAWARLDGWGWLPGMDPSLEDEAARRRLIDFCRGEFKRQLDGLTIHPDSDRALREMVALARAHGARVGFVYLPESAEFQSWYSADAEKAARAHFAALSRELNVPVINARNWMDARYLADGFHLSRIGAGEFTARLGRHITTTFPELGEEP
jgi:hypothetical protein